MLRKAIAALPFLAYTLATQVEQESAIESIVEEICAEDPEAADFCSKERSFGSNWAQEIIEAINGYGCWCYFQDAHGNGRGSPVNEVDEQCKILQDGYSCIIMDAEEEGDDCTNPWDEKYNSATGLGLMTTDENNDSLEDALRFKCKKANRKNNCAARTCMVENYFVIRLVRLFLHGVKFDPSVKHTLGSFDPKADCPIKDGVKSEKECCGEYPLRFPYKTLFGDRACCGERTYNTAIMMCCDDGSVKISC